MQRASGLFDDMARLMTGAVGVAQGVQEEAKTFMRAQAEKVAADMDLVSRDEFEAVKTLAARAQDEVATLKERLAALEERLAAGPR
jgi:BMFP domain-containing protein YqiC